MGATVKYKGQAITTLSGEQTKTLKTSGKYCEADIVVENEQDDIIINISITHAPTKTNYSAGETLDLTGIVVTATRISGTTENVTSSCTFSPTSGTRIYEQTTAVTATYTDSDTGITLTAQTPITVTRVLDAIVITHNPNKTTYDSGETLDLTGLAVRADFNSGASETIIGYTTNPAAGTSLTPSVKSVTVSYTESGVTKTASFSVTVRIEIVPWATGTDEQILAMINAADSGDLDLYDYWQVGQERTVQLSAMSATGVGESHVAQSVTFVLMDKTLTGMTPANASKPLHFAVGLKHSLNEAGYMNSSNTNTNGWSGSARRTWCNNVFPNSLPSTFKSCFRQFKWKTGKGGDASSGLLETTDLFALACEKQIFGSVAYSQSDEANLYNHWQWYQTASNRKKNLNGSASLWWESSPRSGGSAAFCAVDSNGNAGYYYASNARGVAPFGCI